MSEAEEIEAFLRQHNAFAECIIEELALKHYATTLEVVINYIWDDDGGIRSNLDESRRILLRFQLVEALNIKNGLTLAMLKHPEDMNWGMNEIALVELTMDAETERSEVGYKHLTFFWEGDRRMDVIFVNFEALTLD